MKKLKFLLEFILENQRLPLAKRLIVVIIHIVPLPQPLKNLPLLLDAQPLGHRVGQQGRLRPRDRRLVVLVHIPCRLHLPPERHRLVGSEFARQALCIFRTIYSPPRILERGLGGEA